MPPNRRGRPAKKALPSNAEEAKESQVEDKDAELFYREGKFGNPQPLINFYFSSKP